MCWHAEDNLKINQDQDNMQNFVERPLMQLIACLTLIYVENFKEL